MSFMNVIYLYSISQNNYINIYTVHILIKNYLLRRVEMEP